MPELRWLQAGIPSVGDWSTSMLRLNGIQSFSRGVELLGGGNLAVLGSAVLEVRNDAGVQSNKLDALALEGSWCDLVSFEDFGITVFGARIFLSTGSGDDADVGQYADPPLLAGTRRWCGRVKSISAALDRVTITLERPARGRVTNLLKQVNLGDYPYASADLIGETVPGTFGKLHPVLDADGVMTRGSMALFNRVGDKQDFDLFTNATMTEEGTDPDIKIFPVTAVYNGTEVVLALNGTPKTFTVTDDAYLWVVDGTGKGQRRKISGMAILANPGYCTVYVEAAFKTALSEANDDTRSWCQLIDVRRLFAADFWPCRSFVENTSGDEVTEPEIYVAENDAFLEVSSYGLEVSDSNKNLLNIKAHQYADDLDTLDSFKIFPVTSINYVTDLTLENYSFTGLDYSAYDRFKKGAWYGYPGTYLRVNAGKDPTEEFAMTCSLYSGDPSDPNFTGELGDAAYDRDVDTSIDFDITGSFSPGAPPDDSYDFNYVLALRLGLPEIPKNMDVEEIYLGLKMTNEVTTVNAGGASDLHVRLVAMLRRFAYTKASDGLFEDEYLDGNDPSKTFLHTVDDIPSFYAANADAENRQFYEEVNTTTAVSRTIKGYTLFKIGDGMTVDAYNTFRELALLVERHIINNAFTLTDAVKVHEAAIIFKLGTANIGKKIYSPLAGRIFDDDYEGRKTPASLAATVDEVMEMVCRLENFSEACSIPAAGWGHAYAASPLINTSDFDEVKDFSAYRPAFCLTDYDDGYTDRIKQELCKTFHAASYVDDAREERFTGIKKAGASPVKAFTLAGNIVDRNGIKIKRRTGDGVYPELFVRYEKNIATGEYDGLLEIKQPDAAAYAASLVTGIPDGTTAERIWNKARTLYLRYFKKPKPPAVVTDLPFAGGQDGFSIAANYLEGLFDHWIDTPAEVEFEVPLAEALGLSEIDPISLTIPHYNDGGATTMRITDIEIRPNPPYLARIRAI